MPSYDISALAAPRPPYRQTGESIVPSMTRTIRERRRHGVAMEIVPHGVADGASADEPVGQVHGTCRMQDRHEPLVGSEDALQRVVLLADHGRSSLVGHKATVKPSPVCHPDRNGHDCRYRVLRKREERFQIAVGGGHEATVLASHGQPPFNRVSLAPQQGPCLPPDDFATLEKNGVWARLWQGLPMAGMTPVHPTLVPLGGAAQ
jgi:hypothetical protein